MIRSRWARTSNRASHHPAAVRVAQRDRPDHRPLPLPRPGRPQPRKVVDEDGQPLTLRELRPTTGQFGPASDSSEVPVGEWLDSAELPTLSRDMLEKASGIEIPGRDFVLKVILAYILVLVPVNYADLPLPAPPARVGLGRGPDALAGLRHRGRAGGGLRRGLRLLLRRGRPDRDPRRLPPGATSAGSPRSTRPAGSSSRSPIPTTPRPWRSRWRPADRSGARTRPSRASRPSRSPP